jgi:hypothetical protein
MNEKILIWWVEDDEDIYKNLQGQIAEKVSAKNIKIERFENLRFLNEKTGSPNIIIVDVAGMFGGAMNMALAPLGYYSKIFASVVEKHPGAIYGIYSIVGFWASDFIREVKRITNEPIIEDLYINLAGKEPEEWSKPWGIGLTLKKFFEKYIIKDGGTND